VPASYLSAFLGASFAFASAASVAFAAAGSAVEDAEEDELEWLSRFGGGGPRQGSLQQSYNPNYGPEFGAGRTGSSAFGNQGPVRQGYIQGRGSTNQQRRGPMMNQQRRGSNNRYSNDRYSNDRYSNDRYSNDRYSGVVVPTGQGDDVRLAEPRDAEWRESLRSQRFRRR
jgi:hypothetical protein